MASFIKLVGMAQLFAAGQILINLLQVYNWFKRKQICTMLALYFIAQFLAYLTPAQMDQRVYWACQPIWYYIGGGVFIVLGILDCWAFQFNPL